MFYFSKLSKELQKEFIDFILEQEDLDQLCSTKTERKDATEWTTEMALHFIVSDYLNQRREKRGQTFLRNV